MWPVVTRLPRYATRVRWAPTQNWGVGHLSWLSAVRGLQDPSGNRVTRVTQQEIFIWLLIKSPDRETVFVM
jgi:hypothetical protein